MKTIKINVHNNIAEPVLPVPNIVCDNSKYTVEFIFDADWAQYDKKTARFIWNNEYFDIEFTGTSCEVPVITNARLLKIGVYAGDLETTTSAVFECVPSILSEKSTPNPGTGQHYSNEAKTAAEEAKASATDAKNSSDSAKQSAQIASENAEKVSAIIPEIEKAQEDITSLNTKMEEVVKTNASQHAGIAGNKKRIDFLEAAAEGKLFAVDENFPTVYFNDDYHEDGVAYSEYYPQALVSKLVINSEEAEQACYVGAFYEDTGDHRYIALAEIPENIRNNPAFAQSYTSHEVTFDGNIVVDFENRYISRTAKNVPLPSDFVGFDCDGGSDYDFCFWYDDIIISDFVDGNYGYHDNSNYFELRGNKIYSWGSYIMDYTDENAVRKALEELAITASLEIRVPISDDMPVTIDVPQTYDWSYGNPTGNGTTVLAAGVFSDYYIDEDNSGEGYGGCTVYDSEYGLNNSSAVIKAYAKI